MKPDWLSHANDFIKPWKENILKPIVIAYARTRDPLAEHTRFCARL